MTLKDFAKEQGVSESTVRSWKLRGKIGQLTEGGPWHFFDATLQRRNATTERNATATRNDATERNADAAGQRDSVTGYDDLSSYPGEMAKPKSVTDSAEKRIEDMSRIEALERDNRILSDAVDSLRDLTTEQGATLSESLKQILWLEGEIATLRAAIGVSNASLIESNNAVMQIQSLISDLRNRVVALEINGKRPELNAGDGSGYRYSIDPPSSGWGP